MNINIARFNAVNILNKQFKLKPIVYHNQIELPYSKESDILLAKEIAAGVIRWKLRLDYIINSLLSKGINKTNKNIVNILRTGIYQILFTDKLPNYAIVNETVEIAKLLKEIKFAGNLVNRILHDFIREKDNIKYPDKEKNIIEYLSIYYSHPKELVKHWISIFGYEDSEELLKANNQRANITLRVNKLLSSEKEIEEYLNNNNINFNRIDKYNNIFVLNKANGNISNNALFKNGKITIQDTSTILVSNLVCPEKNSLVLDMCAAPGGKTCCLSELMNNTGVITANDITEKKISLIQENINRLKIKNIRLSCCDALELNEKNKFNYILLDAPCSGLGTIRKLPEIKYANRLTTINNTVELQRKLLSKAVNLLRDNGVLVYSTCSIEPTENYKNIEWFLNKYKNFRLDPAEGYIDNFYCKNGYLQIFPHIHNCDGAFAARLIKDNL